MYETGDLVRFINEERHDDQPEYYPEPGTIGTITMVDAHDDYEPYKVQWPRGSTSLDDRWWARAVDVVRVDSPYDPDEDDGYDDAELDVDFSELFS